jgi:hypothetical protein
VYASTETLPAPPTLSATVTRRLNGAVCNRPMGITHLRGGGRSGRRVTRSAAKKTTVHAAVARAMNMYGPE